MNLAGRWTLSYAASLHGLMRQDLEETIPSKHLQGQPLFDRVRESVQEEGLTQSEFEEAVEAHLATGSFRAVIVLDAALVELIDLGLRGGVHHTNWPPVQLR